MIFQSCKTEYQNNSISFIVCDDVPTEGEIIRTLIVDYLNKKTQPFDINVYSQPQKLLDELCSVKKEAIFILDVGMPLINGFELAEKIRSFSESAVIIFLTSHEDLAIHGYKSKALRYVLKAEMKQNLPEALDAAIKEIQCVENEFVLLKHYNDYIRIQYKDIAYVTYVSRKSVIHTSNFGELTDNRGITGFYDLLHDKRFVFIDRGCFVNIDYIDKIVGYELTIRNGEVLFISRRALQPLKEAMLEQWGMN